ncbi:HAD-IA family hydrolase [Colwellia sp. 4_MG-2023]|uniref:HAD family hydrolase n=1 Tax=unclassified Colwellia TaxID=196834 RepID=UPI0026E25DAD|nr:MULTISPECIES: HAD-IA family hydrolase [unclassified Colwellia]MDO6505398.1 HAD-IA family hydrolase [Colwellia sp. 5_MG-2023]MDO6554306.1 HAD-IA family hydrolase [Colwellia sp. 4_MG-2023]
MKNYKLIIFDWDGTLMNSVDRIVSSMQSAADTVGLVTPTNNEVKDIIGLSLPVVFDRLFTDITAEQIEAMSVQYKYQYLEVNTTPSPLFNDAMELLVTLKQHNKLLAVATGKGRAGLASVLSLSNTTNLFHTTRCADEMPSKPDPTMLLSILSELGISSHEALMIGDTSYDLKMAKNAGIDSIGVSFGVHDKPTLEKYSPKFIVDSLSELKALLV